MYNILTLLKIRILLKFNLSIYKISHLSSKIPYVKTTEFCFQKANFYIFLRRNARSPDLYSKLKLLHSEWKLKFVCMKINEL